MKSTLQSIEIVFLNVLQMPAAKMTLSFSVLFVSLSSCQFLIFQLKSVITEGKKVLCRHSQQLTLASTLQASHWQNLKWFPNVINSALPAER